MKRKRSVRSKLGLSVLAIFLSFMMIATSMQPTYGIEDGVVAEQFCEACGLTIEFNEEGVNVHTCPVVEQVVAPLIETPAPTSDEVEEYEEESEEEVVAPPSDSPDVVVEPDDEVDVTDDDVIVPDDNGDDVDDVVVPDTPVVPDDVVVPEIPIVNDEPGRVPFRPSRPFIDMNDRERYFVDSQIEGLPAFIDLEMIVGALKAQDEFGHPASVTIAQVIQESGYGRYGPFGDEGEGLSYLAYRYNNLFGIKGEGPLGIVEFRTREMTPLGGMFEIYAGFRVYNTFSESILDRSELIERRYYDLIEDVEDANTFAVQIARRWATDLFYGSRLIRIMERYDLYRLDELTLGEFQDELGFFVNPVPGSFVSSPFGWRLHPIHGEELFHAGIDLSTNGAYLPIYAARGGVVTFEGYGPISGNFIVIDHGEGIVTIYRHNSMNLVTIGQEVQMGQQIGVVGSTGLSTGNHLHFQVEIRGIPVNPAQFLSFGLRDSR